MKAATWGMLAGAVGTLAMDVLWYRRHRNEGGEAGFLEWEFSTGTEGFDQVGAPAQVAKEVSQAVVGEAPPPEAAGLANDMVHWLTGMGWGAVHGVAATFVPSPLVVLGSMTALVPWASSYAVLAPSRLYKPMWEYPARKLWKDLSAHFVFGWVTTGVFRALTTRK